jgi:hypothetical protein
MDYVLSYDSYREDNSFDKPIFLWNESSKCLKVGKYYLFLEKEIVLEEGDERLNEEFGLSSLIPQTTSDWVHLGVDGVSAIVSALGGKFVGIGIVIDILHSISYFMEAYYKPNEAFGLTLCGVITALFAPIPAFGAESIGGAVIKRTITAVSKLSGGFFKTLFSLGASILPINLFKRLFKYIFNLQPVRKIFLDIILKYEDTWAFKMLLRVPGVKKMIDFIKNDLSVVLANAEKYIAKDFIVFKKAVISESQKVFSARLKSLDPIVSKMITEEQLGRLGKAIATKEMNRFTPDLISKKPELILNILKNDGISFTEKLCNKSMRTINADLKTIKNEVAKTLGNESSQVLKAVEKEAVEHYITKLTVKDMPYENIIKSATKKLPAEILKSVSSSLLKRAGIVTVKNLISNTDITSATSTTDNNKQQTTPSDSKKEEPLNPNIDSEVSFAKENGLTVEEVDSPSEIGNLNIEFRTPEKDGEDGKLILHGGVFLDFDLTPTMNLYPSTEKLLDDLQFVGKKSEDKTRLRDSQYKKWEKSGVRTTPWIKNLNCRYEFYFLIRERSDISLYKKNHMETVNFNFLDGDKEEYQKLNGSLFLIVKKVERNG